MQKKKDFDKYMNKPVATPKRAFKKVESEMQETNKENEVTDVYNNEIAKEALKRSKAIKAELKKVESSFMRVAFNLNWFKEKNAFLALGYDSIEELAIKEFGIKKTTAYDFLKVIDRFGLRESDGSIVELKDDYKLYSSTKLICMASLTDNEIKENIKPDMSVSEIKKVKKHINDGLKSDNEEEQNINADNDNDEVNDNTLPFSDDGTAEQEIVDTTGIEVQFAKLMTFYGYEDFIKSIPLIKEEVKKAFNNPLKNIKVTINSEWV